MKNSIKIDNKYYYAIVISILILLSRLLLLIILGYFTSKKEFTDDVYMHIEMIEKPFSYILGTASKHTQHPPFLALMEFFFAYPLKSVFSDFYAIRITYILYEVFSVGLISIAINNFAKNFDQFKTKLAILLILSPMSWMTSVVMAQDEVIGAFFISLTLFFLSLKKENIALIICSFGVVAGKIFLLIPLCALVLSHKPMSKALLLKRILCAFLPIAIVYLVVICGYYINNINNEANASGSISLASFQPDAPFGINLWVLAIKKYNITSSYSRITSSVISAVGCLFILLYFYKRFFLFSTEQLSINVEGISNSKNNSSHEGIYFFSLSTVAMLFWVLIVFYHVNPEYYIFILPFTCFFLKYTTKDLFYFAFISILPWSINFFYGINNAIEHPSNNGKAVFIKLYKKLFFVEPIILFNTSLILLSIFSFFYMFEVLKKVKNISSDFNRTK